MLLFLSLIPEAWTILLPLCHQSRVLACVDWLPANSWIIEFPPHLSIPLSRVVLKQEWNHPALHQNCLEWKPVVSLNLGQWYWNFIKSKKYISWEKYLLCFGLFYISFHWKHAKYICLEISFFFAGKQELVAMGREVDWLLLLTL